MNRRERALNALDFKEPDVVPIWELSIDGPHIETLTGMKWVGSAKETNLDRRSIERHNLEAKVLCYNKLEFAMITGAPSSPDGWMPKTFLNGAYLDEWSRIRVYDPRAKNYFVTRGVINTPEDFENFVTPNPHASGVLSAFEYLVKLARGEMAIAAEVRAPFATAWEMFGVQNFCQWLHERPRFIRKALERITNYNIELIKVMADAGADVILSADTSGISPMIFAFFASM